MLSLVVWLCWLMGSAFAEPAPADPSQSAAAPRPVTHWAFQPIRPIQPPPAANVGRTGQTPIDRFILAELRKKSLDLSPPADRRTLLRRASYDLTGLPPSPEEVEAFVADPSPDAFAQQIDRLLASAAYGERWGRHWLDVVRYADARDLIQLPMESDFREAWRYRDWVVKAHNLDLPYPDFVRWQIAGDLLQPSDPEQLNADALVATGFLAIADFVPGDVDKDLMIADYVNDQIDVMGRSILGLTLGCARCHDHKFDPISMDDYYGLAGIFFSTRLIPKLILGNTPLVRVPLLPKAELARHEAQSQQINTLKSELERLRSEAEVAQFAELERAAAQETARHLLACWEYATAGSPSGGSAVDELAQRHQLSPKRLTSWLDYLGLRHYPGLTSVSLDVGGIKGLKRWSDGHPGSPAVSVNVNTQRVESAGVRYPARSVCLTSTGERGASVGWVSPFNGQARITGRWVDLGGERGKGSKATLDLQARNGRRSLAALSLTPGQAHHFTNFPGSEAWTSLDLRAGERLEWTLQPQAGQASSGQLEWRIIAEITGQIWDLAEAMTGDDRSREWHFCDTADVRRPGMEFAQGNPVWNEWRSLLAEQTLSSTSGTQAKARQVVDRLQANLSSASNRLGETASLLSQSNATPLLKPIVSLRANEARSVDLQSPPRVTRWPNRGGSTARHATVAAGSLGPLRTNATVNGKPRTVLHFDGKELLELGEAVPPTGTVFLVYRPADPAASGQRLIGWEDSDRGKHGVGVMLTSGGGLHAILRKEGAAADIVVPPATNAPFEILTLGWGSGGTWLHRQGRLVGQSTAIDRVTSDPEIKSLRLGGPGSGAAARFRGDLAEVHIYNQLLATQMVAAIERELAARWVEGSGSEGQPATPDQLAYEEVASAQGPYYSGTAESEAAPNLPMAAQIARVKTELAALQLQASSRSNLPQAVVVQEGGPPGTPHEGFKDAAIYVRGNHKKPGRIVPRRFPVALAGGQQPKITEGSGRRALAEWIGSLENPLAVRVAVNRIWQYHFGEGIVRTPTNFGERGERPSHPDLLDYLAGRFIESGGSMKVLHRLIMLSAVYQQDSRASEEALAADPENRLLSRMNRQRLDAEGIRDSLLRVAGRLDPAVGGAGFLELTIPRRSLYLMSVRTGAKSGFASVFDAPDCAAVVERRSVSTIAPQALFLLNDPFMAELATDLAHRIRQSGAAAEPQGQIRHAYRLVFGRLPTTAEVQIGQELLRTATATNALERYCQLLLCSNEFIYVD